MYSALLIAQSLGGRIALIDTERESGSLYADLCEFDTAAFTPPYTPEKYRNAIQAPELADYSVLMIDSFSHAWAGEDGLLDMHDKAVAIMRSGNSLTAWRENTPQHNALVETVLGARLHIIATLRTKTAYDLIDDGNGMWFRDRSSVFGGSEFRGFRVQRMKCRYCPVKTKRSTGHCITTAHKMV